MKACPKCQTKNQDSSQFCKKCGVKLTGSTFEDKKEKVLGEKKGKPPWVMVSLAVIAIALGGIAYWLIQWRFRSKFQGLLSTKGERKSGLYRANDRHDRCFSESGEWKDLHPCRNGFGKEDGALRIRR